VANKNGQKVDLVAEIEQQIASRERAFFDKHRGPEGAPPGRQLTDDELKILGAAYRRGLQRIRLCYEERGGKLLQKILVSRLIDLTLNLDPDSVYESKQEILSLSDELRCQSGNSDVVDFTKAVSRLISDSWKRENLSLIKEMAVVLSRKVL
jgi:hypothetical protein